VPQSKSDSRNQSTSANWNNHCIECAILVELGRECCERLDLEEHLNRQSNIPTNQQINNIVSKSNDAERDSISGKETKSWLQWTERTLNAQPSCACH
jgi:hypothetical protein